MFGNLIYWIKALRFIPHLIIANTSKQNAVLEYERICWLKANHLNITNPIKGYIYLFSAFPEYRSLFYHRTGKNFLRHFAKGQVNLYFHTSNEQIGRGLIIWHGYSTVINAKSIGENCQIWHNVTIGKKNTREEDDRPTIGNNVKICTGAIVIGNINITDDVIVAAGTTVIDSVNQEKSIIAGTKGILK